MSSKSNIITFEGHRNFRLRLILSLLSGKSIKIVKIRSDDLNPGLKDYEVSFLRLLESITNGSHIEISYTGTTIIFKPGIIIGGDLTHNCPHSKPIGYFVEFIIMLAPFSKKKFNIIFKGLTNSHDDQDSGIDLVKWGLLPIMEKFGVREISLHILKRGSPPLGGGEVHFQCNSLIQQLLTIHSVDIPKFSIIRGIAYCTRVSPSVVNRMIDTSRKILKSTGCEVNITADVWRGENSGKSPGFGITLIAENKRGWRILCENTGKANELPEELSEGTTYQLLDEITKSGCIGRFQILLCLVYMSIGKEDIGRIIIHKDQVDEKFIYNLRDIKQILGVEAFLKEDEEDNNFIIVNVKGNGFTSISKKVA
ncbi:unnamed protein product [Candida verbasci]|uniref:RNA 3'-terminal phosphate cyclase-like protein n=1 Tax=Candida verbasci TaxID=1227364 RepID=A0A9W4XGK9_9ASCO|nr:unnamed protein product [Candida verbasci]